MGLFLVYINMHNFSLVQEMRDAYGENALIFISADIYLDLYLGILVLPSISLIIVTI